MTHLALALLLAAAQSPEPADPAPAPAQDSGDPVPVLTTPTGVEAPAPPAGESRARFRRTTRVRPASSVGFTGKLVTPVRSLVAVRGMEDNTVVGFGLVTGLAGTGDSGALATQLLANTLLASNINVDPSLLASANIAVVRVEGTIPAGAKPGRKFDVRVSTIGDADSLVGGVLDFTELTDATGSVVFGTASGPVTVGGFSAAGQGASARKNHVTVGTLAGGGTVQREIATSVVSEHGYIYLDSRNGQASFGNAVRIAESINHLFPGAATVLPDARTVRVRVLDDLPPDMHVAYLDTLLSQEVETDNLARVVINERTGVIVMGGDVRLRPGVITHGSIVVTVAETPQASQPGPFSAGETVELPRTDLEVTEGDAPLVMLGGASSLEEVVDVLNVLGATPRDMISILEAMVDGGLLVAELRRM